jgi:hypothetical protein
LRGTLRHDGNSPVLPKDDPAEALNSSLRIERGLT